MAKDGKQESQGERTALHHMTVAHLRKPVQNPTPTEIKQRQMTVAHLAKPLASGGQSGGGASKDSDSNKK